MLTNLIADIFPQAIGVAFSSAPVIVLTLILFGAQARSNGLGFMLGWMAGVAVVGSLALELANAGRISAGGGPLQITYGLRFLFGLLLLFMAYHSWQPRPAANEQPSMPSWMASLESLSTRKIFGLGFMLVIANPKNLVLTISAALIIAEAGLIARNSWIALAVFVVLSSFTIIAPVAYFLYARESAESRLSGLKSWLIANNATIQIGVCLVFGTLLAVTGLKGLVG